MGRSVVCVEMEQHFLETMSGYDCDGTVSGWEVVEYDNPWLDKPYASRCHKRLGLHAPHHIQSSWERMRQHPMLGFAKSDEWTRELWSLSFWRILQKRRDPEAFDERLMFEYVQAYRKSNGQP